MSTTTATRSPYARMFALPGAKAFCLQGLLFIIKDAKLLQGCLFCFLKPALGLHIKV